MKRVAATPATAAAIAIMSLLEKEDDEEEEEVVEPLPKPSVVAVEVAALLLVVEALTPLGEVGDDVDGVPVGAGFAIGPTAIVDVTVGGSYPSSWLHVSNIAAIAPSVLNQHTPLGESKNDTVVPHDVSANPTICTSPFWQEAVGNPTDPRPVVTRHSFIGMLTVGFSVLASLQSKSVYNFNGTWD